MCFMTPARCRAYAERRARAEQKTFHVVVTGDNRQRYRVVESEPPTARTTADEHLVLLSIDPDTLER